MNGNCVHGVELDADVKCLACEAGMGPSAEDESNELRRQLAETQQKLAESMENHRIISDALASPPQESPQAAGGEGAANQRALANAVDNFGPWHDDDCPEDDTCNCSGKPLNDLVNVALKGLSHTPRQQELKDAHGTPKEFADACSRAVGDFISVDERNVGVAEYKREWAEAGNVPSPSGAEAAQVPTNAEAPCPNCHRPEIEDNDGVVCRCQTTPQPQPSAPVPPLNRCKCGGEAKMFRLKGVAILMCANGCTDSEGMVSGFTTEADADAAWNLANPDPLDAICKCGHAREEHDEHSCNVIFDSTDTEIDMCPCKAFDPAPVDSSAAKVETEPLLCMYCAALGPQYPVDADHPGWMCPACREKAQKEERCGHVPETPGYAPCTRAFGHSGPCAHELLQSELHGKAER